jgi:hypothetical protein
MSEILIGIYILFGVCCGFYWLYVDTYKALGRIVIFEFIIALFVAAVWPSYVIARILSVILLYPIIKNK